MPASGIVAEPTHLLAELVASSATFQTETGAADETAALAFVHEVSVRGTDVVRPMAVVSSLRNHSTGRGGFGTGMLLLIFEDDVPDGYGRDDVTEGEPDNSAGSLPFRNWVGAVIDEMWDEQENGGRLLVRKIDQDGELTRSGPDDASDYFQQRYLVQWGATPK
jgi:hypothetical protein